MIPKPVEDAIDGIVLPSWAVGAVVVVFAVYWAITGLAKTIESGNVIKRWLSDCWTIVTRKKVSDSSLHKETAKIARELAEFLRVRQLNEPAFAFADFHESADQLTRYSQETQALYVRDYAPRVLWLRGELLKRGLQSDELDRFVNSPTNYIGLRIVAAELGALGERVGRS